ncbi:Uncharacterised protein [Sphingobacterium multivorum]|uniref:Uncharacterized protein n=1 Tax=Sphingobacterium multivorum TaxID=28454 RepID=A0A2X2JVC5_SPHMU|nr:Uncharacterised protein [Sphingobacterium multivorum]SUJ02463.1 Uncharacterised protein [Sphingobacterium multivorum]
MFGSFWSRIYVGFSLNSMVKNSIYKKGDNLSIITFFIYFQIKDYPFDNAAAPDTISVNSVVIAA